LAKANNNRSQVTTEQFYSRKYVVSKDCSAARQRVTAKPPPTPQKKKKKRLELMKHLARQKEECLADDKLRTMRIRWEDSKDPPQNPTNNSIENKKALHLVQ